MTDHVWQVGQRVVLNREKVVTIEKVTPSGCAKINEKVFEVNGQERTSSYRRSKIEPLTAETEVGMALEKRCGDASLALERAVRGALAWSSGRFSNAWTRREPCPADIEKAERIVAAIKREMGDGE